MILGLPPGGMRSFGHLPTGAEVTAYTLANRQGMSVDILNYGGIVAALRASDRDGHMADVVLGFDSLDRYLAGHPYFGAIAGRVAGRITAGRFVLDGRTYELARNDPPNHLHGGRVGFDQRLWAAQPINPSSLRLTYFSPDGEEGYPGAIDVAVTYTLTHANELIVDTEASSDRATPVSLTNHSYFNLAGEDAGTVADHMLQIFADSYVGTDEHLTLRGRREPVSGQPNDFNRARRIGDALPGLFRNHGDLYFLRRPPDSGDETYPLVPVAQLTEPRSGRILTVSTTEPWLQFYTGAFLDGTLIGKSGRAYGAYAGLCLECEGYPDAVNSPELGDILVRPGRPQRTRTVYAFSALKSS